MAAYIRDWGAYVCETPNRIEWNDYIPSISILRYAWKNWGTQFMKGVNIISSSTVQQGRIMSSDEWFRYMPPNSILITNRANVGYPTSNWAFIAAPGKIIFPIVQTTDQTTNWMWLEKAYAYAMGLNVTDYNTLAPYAVPTNYLPFCTWYKSKFPGQVGQCNTCGPARLCTEPIWIGSERDPYVQRAYCQWKWEMAGFPQI